ncbi:MAG: tetratricopeptide repeat protein [Halobacteria archaeon]|nr:tetratricopeptide repeat protein [Halobacteria archaeon]
MNELPLITDVSNESFKTLVTERSRALPVLVDYWADWCGPCQMQMPVLKKLVEDYNGGFALAKVNTDEQRELARTHNIRSLPTMRLYRNGEVAEEILGAQTESTLRILLDRYVERASDTQRAQARELCAAGEVQQAVALLQAAHQAEPDNHGLTLDYAELCFRAGDADEAGRLLDALPRDIRDQPGAVRLRALLEFAAAVPAGQTTDELESAVTARPDDSESRYRLGCAYVMEEKYEQAADTFMHILQQDRQFRDDAGRKALLALFSLLDESDERIATWRRRMFTALH